MNGYASAGIWRPLRLLRRARLTALSVVFALLTSGAAVAAETIDEVVDSACSTSRVEGLSLQIIAEGNCSAEGEFAELANYENVTLGGAVLPFMELPARDALHRALDANPEKAMQINSMLRTVPQQYLLYRWYQLGRCNIGLAAKPGRSNHESGLAIDISEREAWRPMLENQGFVWFGVGDAVHYDYEGPDAVDLRGLDVLAFQRLHNLNNPDDAITEDGVYGPETGARLAIAPADGFELGPSCGSDDGEGGGGGGGIGGGADEVGGYGHSNQTQQAAGCRLGPARGNHAGWFAAMLALAWVRRRYRSGRC